MPSPATYTPRTCSTSRCCPCCVGCCSAASSTPPSRRRLGATTSPSRSTATKSDPWLIGSGSYATSTPATTPPTSHSQKPWRHRSTRATPNSTTASTTPVCTYCTKHTDLPPAGSVGGKLSRGQACSSAPASRVAARQSSWAGVIRRTQAQSCGARTMPAPTSYGSKSAAIPLSDAFPASRPSSCRASRNPPSCSFSAHRAATPATCGAAMDVPLIEASPPPSFADTMPTPGPETSAPVLENGATVHPPGPVPSAACLLYTSD